MKQEQELFLKSSWYVYDVHGLHTYLLPVVKEDVSGVCVGRRQPALSASDDRCNVIVDKFQLCHSPLVARGGGGALRRGPFNCSARDARMSFVACALDSSRKSACSDVRTLLLDRNGGPLQQRAVNGR
jgi:hypothetical protein